MSDENGRALPPAAKISKQAAPAPFARPSAGGDTAVSPSSEPQRNGGSVLLVVEPLLMPSVQAVLDEIGCTVRGTAEEPGQALGLARTLRPGLVLMQASLFPRPAKDVTRALSSERIAPVVWLSHTTKESAPASVGAACEAGAMGLLYYPLRPDDTAAVFSFAQTRFWEIASLEIEVRTLTERMEARKLVGRAKAVLMERFRLSERDAFRRIQAQSAALNKPVHEIARAIITASEITV